MNDGENNLFNQNSAGYYASLLSISKIVETMLKAWSLSTRVHASALITRIWFFKNIGAAAAL